jgi:hypothetical protein
MVRLKECTVHLGFLKICYLRCSVLFCSVKYSELCLAGISQKSQPLHPKKSIGAGPFMDLKIYTLAKSLWDCESTAEKIYRFPPNL